MHHHKFLYLLIVLLLLSSLFPSVYSAPPRTGVGKGIVKIAIDKNLPPYSYIDQDGNLVGFNIELLKTMEEYTNFTFDFVPGNWDQCMFRLQNGEVDALMATVPTPQRNKSFAFTETYMHLYFDFYQRASLKPINKISEIGNHTIAVVRGDITEIFLKNWMNETHEKVYLVEVATPQEGLKLVNTNSVDLFMYEIHTSSYYIAKYNLNNVRLTNIQAFSLPIAIAVRKNEPWLVQELNYAIYKVKNSGKYTILYNKWFNPTTNEQIPFYLYVATVALVASVSVIAYLGVRYKRASKRMSAQQIRIENLISLSQTLMEKIPIGILYLKNGRCVYANPEAMKILGYSFKEMNEKRIFKHFLKDGEIKMKTKDGRTKWVFTKSIIYGGGKIISLIDITDKKMLEIKEQKRFEYINNMLDALRNPMQNILFAVEKIEDPKMQEIIKKESDKISNILKEEIE